MLPPAIAQDLQCFLRVLHSRYGEDLVSVVLFGSWARGEARAESDIDLLVISKHFPRSRLDRHRDMFEAVNPTATLILDTVVQVLYAAPLNAPVHQETADVTRLPHPRHNVCHPDV
jgi:predicted nucleotidyltransferase